MRKLILTLLILSFGSRGYSQTLNGGVVGNDQSICYGFAPNTFIELTGPSGGSGTYSFQWERSNDGYNWGSINRATQSIYWAPVLARNTWFRRLVNDGATTASSNIILVSVSENFRGGTIEANVQRICYNTTPGTLIGTTSAMGGSDGEYSYQWQYSINRMDWLDIAGGSGPSSCTPSVPQITDTWYRRLVTNPACGTTSSNVIAVSVVPAVTINAQLHDDITIYNGTSTSLSVDITGGIAPYRINYTINGGPPLETTETNISTGVINVAGTYVYALTSTSDNSGCPVNNVNLGTPVTVSVSTEPYNPGLKTNNALVIVNRQSAIDYAYYSTYIGPYLDNFGIPYDESDVSSLPSFDNYAIIILGHKNLYPTGYPTAVLSNLETALSTDNVGIYSFDPSLFDSPNNFHSTQISPISVTSNQINIVTAGSVSTTHYITQLHLNDIHNPFNNVVNLQANKTITLNQNSILNGGIDLSTMNSGGTVVPLLQVYDNGIGGRIVKWTSYDWMFDDVLGPVFGMDDLIWRGIIWAAKKPFAMQGMPPMITFRVDDVTGYQNGNNAGYDYNWIKICNEFGIIPWCGTFIDAMRTFEWTIPTLKSLTDNGFATSAPHAFSGYMTRNFLFFDHFGVGLNPVANAREALAFYEEYDLTLSNFLIPHWYEVDPDALPIIKNEMGIDYIGIHLDPGNYYATSTQTIQCKPYRTGRYGVGGANGTVPVYYGGNVGFNVDGTVLSFFNCITEIRDDGDGYEWAPMARPGDNATTTANRGIRQLRRSLNSMVLATIFTHEWYFPGVNGGPVITNSVWREILTKLTSGIAGYNPEYRSMDYAVKYVRAKSQINITNLEDDDATINISYSGINDMDTKCYLFSEENGEITFKFIALPQANGDQTVTVLK